MSQANPAGPWILVGGASRAGRAIAARLVGERVVPVVRSPSGLRDEVVVGAYDEVPSDMELAGATIVNCAGTPLGSATELDRANRTVPLAWARAAMDRGAARMVQISSFSVFGPAALVDTATVPAPAGDYGRSKLAAEMELQAAGLGARLTVLRVPILIGGGNDKLARLVGLVRRSGVMPAAPWPTPRSMLSYDGLAATIVEVVRNRKGGVLAAADPLPFSPELLHRRAQAAGVRARILRVPGPALALVRLAAPGVHASLFQSSLLADSANAIPANCDYERIETVIDRLLVA